MTTAHTGIGRLKGCVVATLVVASFSACENRTVVYTSPVPRSSTTYVRTPSRVVTQTVYVKEGKEGEKQPTTLPGAPRRLGEPGEPGNTPAAINEKASESTR